MHDLPKADAKPSVYERGVVLYMPGVKPDSRQGTELMQLWMLAPLQMGAALSAIAMATVVAQLEFFLPVSPRG